MSAELDRLTPEARALAERLLAEAGVGQAFTIDRTDVVQLIAQAVLLGRSIELAEQLADASNEPVCRICACTRTRSCRGGCTWSAPDLCDRCKPFTTLKGA